MVGQSGQVFQFVFSIFPNKQTECIPIQSVYLLFLILILCFHLGESFYSVADLGMF